MSTQAGQKDSATSQNEKIKVPMNEKLFQSSEATSISNISQSISKEEIHMDKELFQLSEASSISNISQPVIKEEVSTTEELFYSPEAFSASNINQSIVKEEIHMVEESFQLSQVSNISDMSQMNVKVENLVSKEMYESFLGSLNLTDNGNFGENEIGRRCVMDMRYFVSQLFTMSEHSKSLECSAEKLEINKVERFGLLTTLNMECTNCGYKAVINTLPVDTKEMNINQKAVVATIIAGGDYTTLQQLLTNINLPGMSVKMYQKYYNDIADALLCCAEMEMIAAAEEEKRLAIQRGDVLPSGIAYIPVVTNNSWSKRSYGTSRCGILSDVVGVIIGYHTKKVLFMGLPNKTCRICQNAEKTGSSPEAHNCCENWSWNQSSYTKSDAIVDGFKTSIAKRELVYSMLIEECNSTMFKKILDCDPYGSLVYVKRIECADDLLQIFCKEMGAILNKNFLHRYAKTVDCSIAKIREAILNAAEIRGNENVSHPEKVRKLRTDITNEVNNVFGGLKEFSKNFHNDGIKDAKNISELQILVVLQQIQEIVRSFLNHSDSLLYNESYSIVESFNSIITKYNIGGRKKHAVNRRSWPVKCAAAVVQFNTTNVIDCLNRTMNKESRLCKQSIKTNVLQQKNN